MSDPYDDEPRYTLDEARPLIALQDCNNQGHQIASTDIDPTSISCGRCGTTWDLTLESVG